MVVRANAREPFRYGGIGLTSEIVTAGTTNRMSVIWSDFKPGAGSGHLAHSVNSDEELILLLAGTLIVKVDGVSHTLEPGDAITFDPRLPHIYENPSSSEHAQTVCILAPPPL